MLMEYIYRNTSISVMQAIFLKKLSWRQLAGFKDF